MVTMEVVRGSGTSGGNGGGDGVGGDYVSQLDPNMSWAQGYENCCHIRYIS